MQDGPLMNKGELAIEAQLLCFLNLRGKESPKGYSQQMRHLLAGYIPMVDQ